MVVATCGKGMGADCGTSAERYEAESADAQLCVELALTPLKRTATSQLLARELEQDTLPAG